MRRQADRCEGLGEREQTRRIGHTQRRGAEAALELAQQDGDALRAQDMEGAREITEDDVQGVRSGSRSDGRHPTIYQETAASEIPLSMSATLAIAGLDSTWSAGISRWAT